MKKELTTIEDLVYMKKALDHSRRVLDEEYEFIFPIIASQYRDDVFAIVAMEGEDPKIDSLRDFSTILGHKISIENFYNYYTQPATIARVKDLVAEVLSHPKHIIRDFLMTKSLRDAHEGILKYLLGSNYKSTLTNELVDYYARYEPFIAQQCVYEFMKRSHYGDVRERLYKLSEGAHFHPMRNNWKWTAPREEYVRELLDYEDKGGDKDHKPFPPTPGFDTNLEVISSTRF